MDVRRTHDPCPLTLRDIECQQHGFGQRRRAVIVAGVAHLHSHQAANHRLVLEDRLQNTLAEFRLIGRIGGVEFAALEDVVDRRRNEVSVASRPQERRDILETSIALSKSADFPAKFQLTQSVGKIQPGKPDIGGNDIEQFFQAVNADRLEHLSTVLVGVGNESHVHFQSS